MAKKRKKNKSKTKRSVSMGAKNKSRVVARAAAKVAASGTIAKSY